jgi:SlyX protein
MTDLEERLVDIEIKLTRQEDITDALNTTIYQQQQKIDELEILLHGLAKRFKEAVSQAGDTGPANERPPHY